MQKEQDGTSQEQHINYCISLRPVSEASTETKIPPTLSIYNLCCKCVSTYYQQQKTVPHRTVTTFESVEY